MKRILFSITFLLFTSAAFSQVVFDFGLKAGFNTSNMNVESIVNIDSEAITKMHWGAFGRVGYGRLYIQPELYYSQKGGELSSNLIKESGDFDYNNVDVPLLLGYKLIKGKMLDFRVMAGPVFSFVTDANYPDDLEEYLDEDYFDDHLIGLQYGLGVDVLFLTIDARMEHGSKIYDSSESSDAEVVPISGKATTFMLTVGFKIF